MISAARVENDSASRRLAPPRSVPARTMPAHAIPMQISLARVTASRKTSELAPPVAPRLSAAMIAAGKPASAAEEDAKLRSTVVAKAQRPHQKARSIRKATRSCGKHAVSTTTVEAPITVPIIRNQPLRSEAPSWGWHTTAAEEPAQHGLRSSTQSATNRARHTAVHSRSPNSSDGPTFADFTKADV